LLFSALGDVSAKCNVLEAELSKAHKTIAKSKKATEVQLLMQDNESLKRKLRSQEEDFRAQNQTLLTELSNVSAFNNYCGVGPSSFGRSMETTLHLEKSPFFVRHLALSCSKSNRVLSAPPLSSGPGR
jgi:hypothetical protein